MKRISIIVAMSENSVIGRNNDLPWRLSEDLKRFKMLTTENLVVMGRNTYDSLPKGALPNRENLVLTRDRSITFANCKTANSLDEALLKMSHEKENFIIGGGKIYEQFLPFAQKIYLTKVHTHLDGDTFFPELRFEDWDAVHHEFIPASEKNDFDSTFLILQNSSRV